MPYPGPPLQEALAIPEDQREAKKWPKLIGSYTWLRWLSGLTAEIAQKPARKAAINLSAQAASIAVTPIPMATIPPGIYRVSYFARISRAATVSSALTVTLAWTSNGVAQTSSGDLMNANLTTTHQFRTLVIRVDNTTAISYSTTYASVGGVSALYTLDITLEEVALD